MSKKIGGRSQSEHFTYCGVRECIHTECLRHNINTPWDVLIYRKDYSPDKNWNCKDIVEDKS